MRVWAQSVTLTGPVSPVTVPDGKDFAGSVLHRPWDMNQLRDIALEFGFLDIGVEDGIWTGTSFLDPVNASDPNLDNFYIFPLSPNFLRPDYVPYASFYTNGTPYGPLNPLNANRFSRLSFRMSMDQADRSNVSVFWAKTFNQWPASEGNVVTFYDGEPSYNSGGQFVLLPQPSGFRIYDVDPNRSGVGPGQHPSLATQQNRAGAGWDGSIYSFFIWPSNLADASDGVSVSFDWIRAYDPATSPEVTITWEAANLGPSGSNTLQLYVDTDSSGYDGDLLVAGLENTGSHTLKTAALPPGDYYVYLRAVRHENSAITQTAVSGYSARIRIGAPPLIEVLAPAHLSGDDYATTELNNPWDFQNGSDVVFTSQMSHIAYENGVLTATTDDPVPPLPETDAQIWLNMSRNGQVVPVDTRKYRYFSFRMRVRDEPGYLDIFDKVKRGWESRVLWWTQGVTEDGSYSKDVPLLEGWRTYSVDLWDRNFLEEQSAIPAVPQLGWKEVNEVRQVRFDPMEAHFPTRFWLDRVWLTSENRPENGTYTIRWSIVDPDSSAFTVKIFADLELSPGNLQPASTPLTTLNVGTGEGQWDWTPGNMPGRYFIRVEVNDGSHLTSATSRVHVNTLPPPPPAPDSATLPVPGDYTGDGRDDVVVYEPLTGKWYIYSIVSSTWMVQQWGDSSMVPVPGDYNGNGRFDLALYQPITGMWFIRSLQDGPPITFGQQWGDAGMDPVSGDFNGDGVYDLAVYQRATGNWFIRSLGPLGPDNPPITFGQNWGDAGMAPVSGDFNGDGVFDLSVYQRATGNWFIRSLGPLGPDNPPITFGQNWGDAGMDAVSGDYNRDGVGDLAVYQRATGNWFIRSLGPIGPDNPPITFGQNWGDATMRPIPGDFDGDEAHDLGVYQFTSGNWFIRSLGSGPPILFQFQWGKE